MIVFLYVLFVMMIVLHTTVTADSHYNLLIGNPVTMFGIFLIKCCKMFFFFLHSFYIIPV